ncbi:MAG: hypothetical protein U5L00_15650 [Desulfovermiculus sp.]|nr:hypothetical protein [Desulfovermiculus sp.]
MTSARRDERNLVNNSFQPTSSPLPFKNKACIAGHKEIAQPVYDAVMQGTDDGSWVDYGWKGKKKHAYDQHSFVD